MNSAKFMVCALAATQLFDAMTALEEYDAEYWRTSTYIDDYDSTKIEELIKAWKEYRETMRTA